MRWTFSKSHKFKKDKDSLLPSDRRRRPHPTIRKYNLGDIKTWEEYYKKMRNRLIERCNKHIEGHMAMVLQNGFTTKKGGVDV